MIREALPLQIILTAVLRALSLRITRFEVPSPVVPGQGALLSCGFDLGREKLYSVKWYKDRVEFFRFFPSLNPQYMAFPAPGLDVDLAKSSPSAVYLRNLTLSSEGQYTCQVSADEPYFGCVQVHRDVVVYIPPESSPQIYGELPEFGDNLTVRCSSARSKPAADLSWYANDVLVDPSSLPSTRHVTRHPDRLESSVASLSIPLHSWRHLPERGDLRLVCAATVAGLVTATSDELLISRPREKILELKDSEMGGGGHRASGCVSIAVALLLCVLK